MIILLLILISAFLLPSLSFGAIAHVQTMANDANAGTTNIQTFGLASTTGDLIVVGADWGDTTTPTLTVTDSNNNTYTSLQYEISSDGNRAAQLFYAKNITGGATPITITATLTASAVDHFEVYVSEYSGLDLGNPADQSSEATGSGATANSGSKTTNFSNELIYCYIQDGTVTKTEAGFTARSTFNANLVQDDIVSSTGTYQCTANVTSVNTDIMATFKAPSTTTSSSISGNSTIAGNSIIN
jgi:hypothetical protein